MEGEEVVDTGYTMAYPRRRSNSSSYSAGLKDFKTKFEQIDPEPVFEEGVHGPEEDELVHSSTMQTESSESGASIDEEEKVKKA